jgi:prepilin-type N-terminal cleavage/methylation domain-containing protein
MVTYRRKGFTLIELLIVVAIIGILAAIAIPNFLEAQVRAKVARVQEEFRSLGTALESYSVDNNVYVTALYDPAGGACWPYVEPAQRRLGPLTTPLEYLSTLPWVDPFQNLGITDQTGYQYKDYRGAQICSTSPDVDVVWLALAYSRGCPAWELSSVGPDGNWFWWQVPNWGDPNSWKEYWGDYDSSNGTVSQGDIRRWSSAKAGKLWIPPLEWQ